MELLRQVAAVALASGTLALGSGCLTPNANTNANELKKPDVTRPGVLPPPQNMVKPVGDPVSQTGVVQAGGLQPATVAPSPTAPAVHVPGLSSLSKLAARLEGRVPATEIGLGWQNRIAHLPDPARNGVPGAGLVGQLFLFGGAKLGFVDAEGTLTVDLIDETPRPAGQKPATAERWQFTKELLLKMRTVDETFGKSYVLFLPWPAYRPDITKVRISARYDQPNGDTLYTPPTVLTLDTGHKTSATWETRATAGVVPSGSVTAPPSGMLPASRSLAETLGPTPTGMAGAIPLGGPQPGMPKEPVRSVNLTPLVPQPQPDPLPLLPTTLAPASSTGSSALPVVPVALPPVITPGATAPVPGVIAPVPAPTGLGPVAPALPPGAEPFAITIGQR